MRIEYLKDTEIQGLCGGFSSKDKDIDCMIAIPVNGEARVDLGNVGHNNPIPNIPKCAK